MKSLKFASIAFSMAAAFTMTACDDSTTSSASEEQLSSSSENKTGSSSDEASDPGCFVETGVVVFSPKAGETFKMGDTITVVYGSDVQGSGYRFVFKTSEEDMGLDMFKGSMGPEKTDGKTCYEQKVVLSDEYAEPTETAIIRVIPYEKTSKGSNSATFKVTE